MKKLAILGVTVYSVAQLANAATLNVKPSGTTPGAQPGAPAPPPPP
ncbi:hypothetical protein ACNQOT_17870, partial [Acinetobacter baumannii]